MQDTIAWSKNEKCGLEVLNQVRESSDNDTDTSIMILRKSQAQEVCE